MESPLDQNEADRLIAVPKESILKTVFTWYEGARLEEIFVELGGKESKFLLSLNRNPFEIRLQLRTKGANVGLARVDNAAQHINPDGHVLRGPHLHWYRDGYGLAWAESIDWHDPSKPLDTLRHFLDLVHARFAAGYMEPLL